MLIIALRNCTFNGHDYVYGDTVLEADVDASRFPFLCRRGVITVDKSPTMAIAQVTGLQTALDGKADDADVTAKVSTTTLKSTTAASADFPAYKTAVAGL
jgi:hypothetical protein